MKRKAIVVKGVNLERLEINVNKKLNGYLIRLHDELKKLQPENKELNIKNVKIRNIKFCGIGTWLRSCDNFIYYIKFFDIHKHRYQRIIFDELNLSDKFKLVNELSKKYESLFI
jgi:hypothetical protein